MINTSIDASGFEELRGKVAGATNPEFIDSLLREIAGTMLSRTRKRIHNDGKNADGQSLGTYSPSYLELRRKPTNQGGAADSNPNIRFSFTRDMQRNYSVIPMSKTEYGLGFTNPDDADKANWLEQNPKFGKVWALTTEELDEVRDIIKEFIATKLK